MILTITRAVEDRSGTFRNTMQGLRAVDNARVLNVDFLLPRIMRMTLTEHCDSVITEHKLRRALPEGCFNLFIDGGVAER